MAEIVTVEGQQFKRRSPWGIWGLVFLTIGVYWFVWHYKVNDEARRFLRDDTIRPGISLLAVILGWVLIVPPYVSIYRTGERIVRMQNKAGVQKLAEPILGLVASFFVALHIPYYQTNVNYVWDAAAPPMAIPPPPVPVAPPPPP